MLCRRFPVPAFNQQGQKMFNKTIAWIENNFISFQPILKKIFLDFPVRTYRPVYTIYQDRKCKYDSQSNIDIAE